MKVMLVDDDKKCLAKTEKITKELLPEAEIMNFGITGVRISALFGIHSDNVFVRQAQEDARAWKLGNFFKPYRHLGLNNPISGVYPQLFNEIFGTNTPSMTSTCSQSASERLIISRSLRRSAKLAESTEGAMSFMIYDFKFQVSNF